MIEMKSLLNERDNLLIVIQKQNDLIEKIKHFLNENISDAYNLSLCGIHEEDELDFQDRTPRWHHDIGNSDCANRLKMKISKWEKKYE